MKDGKDKKGEKYKIPALFEQMEPRVLFSAGLEGVLAAEQLDAPTQTYQQILVERTSDSEKKKSSETTALETRVELVFVDPDTPEYQTLLNDLLTYPDDINSYQVFELDNTRDGIAQITAILGNYENVNAIHILSHGTDGAIDLGGSTLNNESLANNSELITSWGDSLGENADILVYGCNLAATVEGQSLVDNLASMTGADVAASEDLTGSAALGGDWDLEYQVGNIETGAVINNSTAAAWNNILDSAPTDLTPGIKLNTGVGNDAYLVSSSGLSQSLASTTVEVRFAANNIPLETVFLSFNTPAGDEFTFHTMQTDGSLQIDFGGGADAYATAMDYRTLLDGTLHSLAISWDNTNGDWAVYADGNFVESGTGLSTGVPLDTTNGKFVFGQEQDTPLDGFWSDQIFSGTLHDIRIWNEVRSGEEIALNYQHKFDSGNLPGGLIANWQMDGFNGSNEVVDVVSGNNLSVGHASGAGFFASTPEATLSVDENSSNGIHVGHVVPTDPDVYNDIVSDGLFTEAGSAAGNPTYFADGSGAGNVLGDWTVTSASVDYVGNIDPPPLGGNAVDLSGDTPGKISQTLTTEAGKEYTVRFALTGNFFPSAEAVKQVRVGAAGLTGDFSITEGANWDWGSNALWEERSFTFTAIATSTALTFESLNTDAWGPIIANVQVKEVHPATQAILTSDPTLTYDAATDKFYRVVSTAEETWSDAQTAAAGATINGVGGQLAVINSAYENALVFSLIVNESYLGASDISAEGEWYWQDDGANAGQIASGNTPSSTTYTNFNATNPNNAGAGQDALVMRNVEGEWDDVIDSVARDYIIEWDASEVLSHFTFALTDDAGGRFSIDSNSGEIIVADGSQLDYETAVSHDITVRTTDSFGNTFDKILTVNVNDMLDIYNNVPGAQSVDEETPLVFNTANGNLISITDAGSAALDVTLTVTDGTLTLSQTTGLAFITGTGTDNATMNFTGTQAAINAALDGMSFMPDENFNGSSTLTITSYDDASLAGAYSFDETGNLGADGSPGTANNGTINGATSANDTTRGNVLSFDGDDSVQVAGHFGDPANLTLSAWVDVTTADTNGADFISLGDSVVLRYAEWSGGSVRGAYYDGATWHELSFSTNLEGAGWHHLAYTVDDTSNLHTLYLDGVAVASNAMTGSVSYTLGADTFIGTHGDGAPQWDLIGQLDDARIYGRSLGAAEIASIMNVPAGKDTDTIAITVDAVNDAPTFIIPGDGSVTTNIAGSTDYAYSITVQPDGKSLVGGYAWTGTDYDFIVTRYNDDGSLDTTFGGGDGIATIDVGGGHDLGYSITMQPDGKILLAGAADNGLDKDFALIRLDSNGILDSSFGGGDGIATTDIAADNDLGKAIALQTDGKIVVAGFTRNGADNNFAVIRYNSNGSIDTTFDTDGIVTTAVPSFSSHIDDVVLQADGKILVIGDAQTGGGSDFAIVRYNTNGSLDATWGGTGLVTTSVGTSADPTSIAIQADGKIVAGGSAFVGGSWDFAAVRYNSNGTLDASFGSGGSTTVEIGPGTDYVSDMVIQPDGKIILAGRTANGVNDDIATVRLNTDGSLDNTFNGDGIATVAVGSGNDSANAIALQADGSILLTGYAVVGGSLDFTVVRYTSDGDLDSTYEAVNTLDGAPTFVEGGAPVVLDADVQVFDEELSAVDNFSGSTLTLVRNGSAINDDKFSATGNLAALTESGGLVLSGVTIGTVITNSAGTLVLDFNSDATQARVNETLQSIAYANSNDAPPASVQIDWDFNDGNSGTQGTGGALSANGSTTVAITATNDTPVGQDDAYTVTQNATIDSTDSWDLADWLFRRTLSFDNITRTENLTGFPVLVTLDASRIDYAQTMANGQDLRFVDSDGTLLDFEIESWNPGGTSTVWVELPQIDASSNTDYMYMYYGNALAPVVSSDAWTSNYSAVYHLDATGTIGDSSANSLDGTTVNMDGTNVIAGQVGSGLDFDGSTEWIDLGTARPDLNNVAAATLSAWINPDTLAGSGDIVSLSVDTGGGASPQASRGAINRVGDEIQVVARTADANSPVVVIQTTTSPLSAGNWQYVVAVIDYANDSIRVYVNGVEQATSGAEAFTPTATPATDSSFASIGSNEAGANSYFDGQIDEARIATTVRSEDWVTAQHASMTDGFITYGYEQQAAGVLGNDIDVDGDTLTATNLDVTGTLGLVALNVDGTFTYDPNGAFDYLAQGEQANDTFTYTANDGTVDSNIVTVTITITGINDAPVIAVVDVTGAITEGTTLSDAGSITFADLDLTDTPTASEATKSVTTALTLTTAQQTAIEDAFTISPDAGNTNNGTINWDYTITEAALDFLADGETVTVVYTITVDDANGGTDTQDVTVTITGANDAPVIAVVDVTGGITEGATLTDSGSITFTDLDLTDTPTASEATKSVTTALTLTVAQQNSIEDAFTISPDAGNTNNGAINWDYTITEAELDFLADGETVTVVYTITVDDANGGTDTQDVTVTITGANDAPVIAVVDVAGAISEGATLTDSGSITFTDLDLTDTPTASEATKSVTTTLTLTTAQQTAIEDAFTISPDAGNTNNGTINWDYTITEAELDFLADGETVTVVYTITVDDANGGTDTQDVTVTITGANDAPVIAVVDVTGSITEGTTLTDSGSITFTDLDLTDTPTASEATKSVTTALTLTVAQQNAIEDAFTISPDAGNTNNGIINWDYTITEAELDFLADGETVTVVYTITVDDANGGTDTQDVTISITGAYDAPVIAVVDVVGAISEGATLTDSGSITFTDLDLTDTPTASEATKSVTTALTLTVAQQTAIEDAFTISPDAGNTNNGTINWDYTITEAELDFLADGETVTVIYTITVNDANGGTDTQDVTVTIAGANDAPVIAMVDVTGAITEGATLNDAGSITFTDLDLTDTPTASEATKSVTTALTLTTAQQTAIEDAFTISPDAGNTNNGTINWDYTITEAELNFLADGETVTVVYTITVDDANGGTDTQDVTVTITGANDAPVIAVVDVTCAITEGATLSDAGSITFTDLDLTDTPNASEATKSVTTALTLTTAQQTAIEDAFTISPDAGNTNNGTINWDYTITEAALDFLADGETVTVVYTITVDDANGGTDTQDVTISITGAYDAPVIAVVDVTGAITEGATLNDAGSITFTDLDLTDTPTATEVTKSVTTALTLTAAQQTAIEDAFTISPDAGNTNNGIINWDYTITEANLDFLADGETVTVVYTITVDDANGGTDTQDVTITITGANDAPDISTVNVTGSITEGTTLTDSGSITFTDLDLTDTPTASEVTKSVTTTLTLTAAQQTAIEDAFTISPDAGNTNNGTINWDYTITEAELDFLADGETVTVVYMITVDDANGGTDTQDVSVTITGANDAPVIAVVDVTGGITEGATLTDSGSITFTDLDLTDTPTATEATKSVTTALTLTAAQQTAIEDSFTISPDAGNTNNGTINWDYTITEAELDFLADGETVTVVYTITVDDANGGTDTRDVTVTITGANDAPVIAVVDVDAIITEGTTLTDSGSITFTDLDLTDTPTVTEVTKSVTTALTLTAAQQTAIEDAFTISPNAGNTNNGTINWDYTITEAELDFLADGETVTVVYTITVDDANGGTDTQDVTVTITGANDAPVISVVDVTASITEGTTLNDSGSITFTDLDLTDTPTASEVTKSVTTALTLTAAQQTAIEDAFTISPDAGNTNNGTINWDYTITEAELDFLADGETVTVVYTITVDDANGGTDTQDVTISITGAYDAPVIAVVDVTGAITEGTTLSDAGSITFTDLDLTDTPTASEATKSVTTALTLTVAQQTAIEDAFTISPDAGNTNNGTINWDYTITESELDFLADGETVTAVYTITVDDANGGTDTQDVTVTITGANDAPVISTVDVTGSITEGATLTDSGSITFTDLDLTDTPTASEATKSVTTALTLTIAQQNAIENAFTISPDAGNINNGIINWDYTITEANLDFLAAGETVTVVYTITVDDANGSTDTQDVTVTITGANDVPVIAVVDVTGGITEGSTLTDGGSITFTDLDLTDTPTAIEATKSVTTALTLTAAQQTAIEDAFTISPDAGNTNNGIINWDYTITEAELDFLADGETVTVVYTITVDDANGGTDTQDVTVTITGANDAPVIAVVDVTGSITEGTTLTDSGSITFTDLDLTDTPTASEVTKSVTTALTLTAAQQTAIEDAFTISPDAGNTNNGTINWDYTITEAELDFLADGETVTVVYTITVDDANGGTDTQDVTVTITGANDVPVIAVVDVTGGITEGSTLTDSGSITFTDLDLTDTPTAIEATKSVTTALTLTVAQQTAIEDAFTISPDAGNTNNGIINWDYTITEANLDFLAAGKTVTVVYTITVNDVNGGTDTQDVTINITGANDASVIAVVDVTGGITEGSTLTDIGSITFTDLDLTDTPTAIEATKSVTTALTLTAGQQTAIEDAFTISPDAGNTNNGIINWDYTITEANLDFLAAGETVTVVYTITVNDANGGTDTQDVTVTITGANDAPVIAVVDVAGSITEGSTLTDSGSITFTDLDLTDTPAASEVTKSVTTALTLTAAQQTAIEDAFTISPDAGNTNNGIINWDYTITEAELDFMEVGDSITVVYTITVNDGNGSTDTQDVTVSITGANDAPVIAVVDVAGSITEGTTLTDSGSITFTDVDTTDTPTATEVTKSVTTALTLTAAQQTAIEDAFTISPDAGNTNNGTINWDYTITEVELDFLAAGETVTVVYTITVDDANGGTDNQDVTVTITGANDVPVIAVVDVTGGITEGSTLTDSGSITFTDLDLTDTPTATEVTKSVTTALTLTAAQQTAIEDAFTISPDAGNINNGIINWDYTITEAELDFLAAGETVTVVYTITVDDGNGGTDTQDVTVTIAGANDIPVIAVVDVTGGITEGSTLTDSGSITLTDLDLTDTPTASEVTKSVTTALTLTAAQQTAIEDAFTISPDAGNTNNGIINWDYTITEAELDFLASGETVTVVYTITVDDANGGTDTQDVTVMITGANDAPVIAVVDVTGAITEGTTLSDAGSITFTDLDLTDTPTASEATKSVTTALTLTIAQQNAVENAFTISPDAGNTNNGTINWDYTITEAELNFLADGETVTVVYTITVDDANGGTDTQDVTVTITGANDAPVIAVVDVTCAITEGATLSDAGSITFTDLDLTDTPNASEATKSVTTALTLTTAQQTAIEDAFTISPDAGNTNNGTINWDYTITEAALDFLADGETVTVVYTITVDDANGGTDTQDVTISITGAYDAPVIAVVDVTGAITEGATLNDAGSITFTDLDLTDTPTATEVTKSVTTALTLTAAQQTAIEDAFTISPDAGNTNNGIINWDYTITEANLDFLADGETVTVVYTITVDDANGGTDTQDVTITITGANDAPDISTVNVTGSITEGTTLTDSGSITFTDLDLTDTPTASEVTKSVTTTLTLTAAQQTAIEDAFTISPDAGNTNNGTINWDYTITEAELDFLADGETVTVVYTITVDDANGGTDTQDVSVTITGANDAPVIAVVDVTGGITEGATLTDSGSITFTDLDLTDTPTASEATKSVTTALTLTVAQQTAIEDAFTISPDAGNTNNGTINWDYTITEANLDFLADGETVTVVYTITVDDANGGTDTRDVTISITGAYDAPVIAVVDVTGSITEGTTLTDSGSITFTDLDLTDTPTATEVTKSVTTALTLTAAQQTAIENAFSISPDAGNTNNGTINWDYTITEAELDFLADGETVTVIFTITVDDANGGTDTQDVTISISGANDSPVISVVDVTGAITEGATLSDSGSITFTDLDLTDTPTASEVTKSFTTTLTLTAAQQTAIENAFTISADAGNTNNGTVNWDYTITEAELDFLADGETVTAVYTITVNDGNGDTDTRDVTVTITGANDAPVITAIGDQSVDEVASLTFTASATDVDVPADTLTFSLDAASLAKGMTINASTGDFNWTPTNGQEGVHTATIIATDDGAGTLFDTETVTITVGDTVTITATSTSPTPDPDAGPSPIVEEKKDSGIKPPNPNTGLPAFRSTNEHHSLSSLVESKSVTDTDIRTTNYQHSLYKDLRHNMYFAKHDLATDMDLWQMVDVMKQQINDNYTEENYMQLIAKSAAGMALSLTAGAVTWALHSSSVVASMLSSVPMWKGFDPLPLIAVARKRRKKESKLSGIDIENDDNAARILDASDTSDTRNTSHD